MFGQQSAAQVQDDIQRQQLLRMQKLIQQANRDPRSLSDDELMLAYEYAQKLGGIDMSQAKKRDKATAWENLRAFGMGAVDSMAFGLIPDHWYSSYRTKTAKNIGKGAGIATSFLIPGGSIGAAKGLLGKGVSAVGTKEGGKLLMQGVKATKAGASTLVKSGKELNRIANQAKRLIRLHPDGATKYTTMAIAETQKVISNLGGVGTKAVSGAFKSMTKEQAINLAKGLIRGSQTLGVAGELKQDMMPQNNMYSPYDPMPMYGM